MWMNEKIARECYRAARCFLDAEKENAYKHLKNEDVRNAAISEICDLDEQIREFLQSEEMQVTEFTAIMARNVLQALDFCIENSARVETACNRWKETKASFEEAWNEVADIL